MAKKIVLDSGFKEHHFQEALLVNFMSWERLIGLIVDAEEKVNERLVGFEIQDDGIMIRFLSKK